MHIHSKKPMRQLLVMLAVFAMLVGLIPQGFVVASTVPAFSNLSIQAVAGTKELSISFTVNATVSLYVQTQLASEPDLTNATFAGDFFADYSSGATNTLNVTMPEHHTQYEVFIKGMTDDGTSSILHKLSATTATAIEISGFSVTPVIASAQANVSFTAGQTGTFFYFIQPAASLDLADKAAFYDQAYVDVPVTEGANSLNANVAHYDTAYETFYFFENAFGGQTALTKATFNSSPVMTISNLAVVPVAASKQANLTFESGQAGNILYYVQLAADPDIADYEALQIVPYEHAAVTVGANTVALNVSDYETPYEVFYVFENAIGGMSVVHKQTFTSSSVLSITNTTTAGVAGKKEVTLNFTSGQEGLIHYFVQPAADADLVDATALFETAYSDAAVTVGANSVTMTVAEFETAYEVFYNFENTVGEYSSVAKQTFTSGKIIDLTNFALTPQLGTKNATIAFTASIPATMSYVVQPASEADLDETTFATHASLTTANVTAGANTLSLTLGEYNTEYELFYQFENPFDFTTELVKGTFTTSSIIVPSVEKVELDSSRKIIYVHFNAALDAELDKTKVTLRNGSALVPQANFSVSLAATNTLRITTVPTLNAIKLTLNPGVVKSDASKAINHALNETSYSPAMFPAVASASVSSDNKTVTVSFKKPTTGNPVIAASKASEGLNSGAGLKSFVTVSTDGKTFNPLAASDTVSVVNEQLVVVFHTALTTQTTTIRVAKDALQLTLTGVANGNLNGELRTAVLDLHPTLVATTIDPTNRVVSLRFSEAVVNASTSKDAATRDAALRAGVRLALDGASFTVEPATVRILKDTVVATFTAKLQKGLTNTNRIRLQNGVVVDARKNNTGVVTTNEIIPDETGPTVNAVGFKASDKSLTLYFNEPIALNGTTIGNLATAISYNSTAKFTAPVARIAGQQLIITHKTTAIPNTGNGGVNNIVIPAGLLKDAADNGTLLITTGAADGTGPTVTGSTLSNSNRDVVITFNEPIFMTGKTIPLTAVSITTGSGASAVTKPISDMIWKTTTTGITIVNGNSLRISNLKVGLSSGNKITIRKDILNDAVFNKNATIDWTL